MKRLWLAAALLAPIALGVSFAVLSSEAALSAVLTPIEPDTRERALIIAAGSGDVAAVRSLLAQGVRAEPETFNAAVIGAFEPRYGPSGCARHAEVTQLLLGANPRLRLGHTVRATVVRRATWTRGCRDVDRLIAD